MWKGTKTMKNRCYLDVHVLQTVPPSCVNRDDTGSPKTAIYGGTTRARVSSQAWKHAMREMFREELIEPDMLGARTKNVISMVAEEILKLNPDAKAAELAEKVLTSAGVKFKDDKKGETKDKKAEALFFMRHRQKHLPRSQFPKARRIRTPAKKHSRTTLLLISRFSGEWLLPKQL